MPRDNSSLNAAAVVAEASLRRRPEMPVGASVIFAAISIVDFAIQIGYATLRWSSLGKVR